MQCSIRAWVSGRPREPVPHPARGAYDKAVTAIADFRTRHMGIVAHYIMAQQAAQAKGANRGLEDAAGGKGTGGMELTSFLRPLRNHAVESVLS
jgi:hypothetical protein